MKKLAFILLMALLGSSAIAQEAKTGWNFGALPTITYSTDMGFQYGALVNLFDYGDGSIYPNYYHMLYVEASTYTKGSSTLRMMYDSDYLIKGIRFTTDLAYLPDQAYAFYGFNGYNAIFNEPWTDDETDEYVSRMFYRNKRQLFRFKNDFIGNLGEGNWKWNAGLTIQNYQMSDVNLDKFNKNREPGDPDYLEDVPVLFDYYKESGLISAEEADGGWVNTVKGGFSYDSRDSRACPMKGIWAETGIEVTPKFLGSESSFGKFYFTWRQYFTIKERDLGFAYRLGYQNTIFGEVPFYYQTQVIVSALRGTESEGLGGSKTLRGVQRNRVVGDGFLYGNAELRWKIVYFKFINQNFYLGANFFYDVGMATSLIDVNVEDLEDYLLDQEGFPGESIDDYYIDEKDKPHSSAGAGIKIAMNENFIISADFGKTFNAQDGGTGFYIGLNYIF